MELPTVTEYPRFYREFREFRLELKNISLDPEVPRHVKRMKLLWGSERLGSLRQRLDLQLETGDPLLRWYHWDLWELTQEVWDDLTQTLEALD